MMIKCYEIAEENLNRINSINNNVEICKICYNICQQLLKHIILEYSDISDVNLSYFNKPQSISHLIGYLSVKLPDFEINLNKLINCQNYFDDLKTQNISFISNIEDVNSCIESAKYCKIRVDEYIQNNKVKE